MDRIQRTFGPQLLIYQAFIEDETRFPKHLARRVLKESPTMSYTRPVKTPTLDRRHRKAQQAMPQKPQSLAKVEKKLHQLAKPVVKPSQIGRLDRSLKDY